MKGWRSQRDFERKGSDQPSITCLDCDMTSYNPNDIANRYCGNCHRFLEEKEVWIKP